MKTYSPSQITPPHDQDHRPVAAARSLRPLRFKPANANRLPDIFLLTVDGSPPAELAPLHEHVTAIAPDEHHDRILLAAGCRTLHLVQGEGRVAQAHQWCPAERAEADSRTVTREHAACAAMTVLWATLTRVPHQG
jgi:hypothetical protein